MAKSLTAIEKVTAGVEIVAMDDDAVRAKLSLLAKIDDPIVVAGIDLFSLWEEKGFNPRSAGSYLMSDNATLEASLRENGWLKRDLMVLSRHVADDGTVGYKVLAGHLRRHVAINIIADDVKNHIAKLGLTDPEEIERVTNEIRDRHPLRYLSALVHDDISHDIERLIAFDHMMRKVLTEYELAKAVGDLICQLSQENKGKLPSDRIIGVWFGQHKSNIQRLRQGYLMPTYWEQYLLHKLGKTNICPDKKHIASLYTAVTKDWEELFYKVGTEGPNFRAEWDRIQSDRNNLAVKPGPKGDTSRPKADLDKYAGGIKSRFDAATVDPKVRDNFAAIIEFAAGKDETPPDEIIHDMANYVNELKNDASRFQIANEGLTAENQRLIGVNAGLNSANWSLLARVKVLEIALNDAQADLKAATDLLATLRGSGVSFPAGWDSISADDAPNSSNEGPSKAEFIADVVENTSQLESGGSETPNLSNFSSPDFTKHMVKTRLDLIPPPSQIDVPLTEFVQATRGTQPLPPQATGNGKARKRAKSV